MYTIKIPLTKNKLYFVYEVIEKLMNVFPNYTFVNRTDSPLDEIEYLEKDGFYYRVIRDKIPPLSLINQSNYTLSFSSDGLDKQGYTLQQYIETCMLFELNEISIIAIPNEHYDINSFDLSQSIAIIEILPDGLNEIHFNGKEYVIEIISAVMNELICMQ